jgi:hypothetical protein
MIYISQERGFTMPKFYVTEEHLGPVATEAQARRLVEILEAAGWEVEYGDGRSDADEDQKLDFERAFYTALDMVSREENLSD